MFSSLRLAKPVFSVILGGVLLSYFGCCGIKEVNAQPELNQLGGNPEHNGMRVIAVNNVPAQVMAWWIDSVNNPIPPLFNAGKQQLQPPQRVPANGKKGFLPAGVERVVRELSVSYL